MNCNSPFCGFVQSSIAKWKIEANNQGITAVYKVTNDQILAENLSPLIDEAKNQLKAYFDHSLTQFDLDLDPQTDSVFYRAVWDQLLTIPYGTTRSYSQIAQNLDNPKAVRAVGLANGKNPIAIIIPCHRVIGASGKLTGYAGGLDVKEYLLKLENPTTFGTQQTLF